MTDGKAQRPEESAQREARSEPIPTPEGQGGGEDARELAQRVIDTWGDGNPPIVVLARALLSSPRVEEVRRMREALEEACNVLHDAACCGATTTRLLMAEREARAALSLQVG